MPVIEHTPGRTGAVRSFVTSNARRTVCVDDTVTPQRYAPAEWGVRFGDSYATPHPTLWDGMHQGTYLTPDEADEMAEHLRRSAAWARAQNLVQGHDDAR